MEHGPRQHEALELATGDGAHGLIEKTRQAKCVNGPIEGHTLGFAR